MDVDPELIDQVLREEGGGELRAGRGAEPGHQLVGDPPFFLLMAPFDVSRPTP